MADFNDDITKQNYVCKRCSCDTANNDMCDECSRDYNTCDRCDGVEKSNDLVWFSEDFEPKEGENLHKDTFNRYDALCEDCYREVLIK